MDIPVHKDIAMQRAPTFRQRLREGQPLFGLFTRLSDTDAMAALAASALDFAVLDVEHSSLGREAIARIAAEARAGDLPLLVRLAGPVEADIHHAIAVGAAGVIVSHVASQAEASAIAAFARGAGLERAYAGMGRAADFRRPGWAQFEALMRERLVVVAQIDDAAGLQAAGDIAAAQGIDAVFAGSLSLALSCKVPASGGALDAIVSRVCDAAAEAGCRMGLHVVTPADLANWKARGASLFVVGNDLNLLRQGADQLVAAVRVGPDRGTR
jgi:2-keto-3-deoxy-L-rhamnonate aldolase RhmA